MIFGNFFGRVMVLTGLASISAYAWKKAGKRVLIAAGIGTASYFTTQEFDSPDKPGSGELIDPILVQKLDSMRVIVGFPIIINSGVRTTEHNKLVGGKKYSAHTAPCYCAVDIKVKSGTQRDKLIRAAMQVGITRIGIAETFLHIDIDSSKPQHVIWTY